MENKKNSKGLIVLLIILVLCVLGLAGYIVYDKVLSKNKKTINANNTSTITQKILGTDKNNKNILMKYGYKEININNNEKLFPKIKKDIIKLETNIENLKKYYINEEYETFEYDNGKIVYSFNNNKVNIYQEIDDVKEIKYDFIDCMGSLYIFAITNNDEIWYKSNMNYSSTEETNSSFIKLKGKYKDVESLLLHSDTCGATVIYLAKDDNDNYYNIENETLFEKNIYYINDNLNFKIMDNRNVYFDNKKTTVLFNFGLYEIVEDKMQYFVSSDNYLYDINLKKYSNSKIKTIMYKNTSTNEYELNNFIIIFDDGKYLEENFYVNL